ncbi:MAG: hypothetical protein AB7T49_17505 [Oligoflexales bacterium]
MTSGKITSISVMMLGLVLSSLGIANDLTTAPQSFYYQGKKVVPMDIQDVLVKYVFDVVSRKASAEAIINFVTAQDGYPFFDLVPPASDIRLNNSTLEKIELVEAPMGVSQIMLIPAPVTSDTLQTLHLAYSLKENVAFSGNGDVSVGFFMGDLIFGGRAFLERYAPANLEFDHVKYTFEAEVSGTDIEHKVYTNGVATKVAKNKWSVAFPDFYTSSSVFFQIAKADRFSEVHFEMPSKFRSVPVLIFGDQQAEVAAAENVARETFAELEETFGPYAHDQLIIRIAGGRGGMEYAGATMTAAYGLPHEIAHSWFARGVMPRDGNAGWIDEAIATWRDNGYVKSASAPAGPPIMMSGFPEFRRHTNMQGYQQGAQLLSQLDFVYRDKGGLKPALRSLYLERKLTTISVGDFKEFLEKFYDQSLDAVFDRYVFGKGDLGSFEEAIRGPWAPLKIVHRPYTSEELRRSL